MATKDEVRRGLERVTEKFEDLNLKEEFRRFEKVVQFMFPDIDLSYVMVIASGTVKELKEGTVTRPNVTITIDSNTFLDIINNETDAITAYSIGKIKFKGAMVDLLKLQKLL